MLPLNISRSVENILSILLNEENIYDNEDKIDALDELWNIADLDFKAELADPNLGLLSLLIQIVTITREDRVMLYYAMGCLWFLSRNITAKILMCAPEYQLPKTLMEIMTLPDLYEDSLQIAENILTNCSMAEDNHEIMFNPELGFLEYIKAQLQDPEAAERPFQTCNFMVFKAQDKSLAYFIRSRIHDVVLQQLFSVGSNLEQWGSEDFVTYWALIFTMSISTLPTGQKILLDNSCLESYLRDIITNQRFLYSPEGLKAGIIYINIFSHSLTTTFVNHQLTNIADEPADFAAPSVLLNNFLDSNPKFLTGILLLIDLTINFSEVNQQEFARLFPGFLAIPLYHSIFTLRDLFSCLKHLSSFSKNRWIMLRMIDRRYRQIKPFSCFYEILDSFLQDKDEYLASGSVAPSRGGGGRKDFLTILSILECALNLSYCLPEDIDDIASINSTSQEEENEELLSKLSMEESKEKKKRENKTERKISNNFNEIKKDLRLFLQKSLEIANIPAKSRGIPEEIYLLVRVILKRLQEDW